MPVQDLTADLLENRSFPQIAATLRARSRQIVERWEQAVRRTLPGADELTLVQVRDHIPAVLERMAKALASDQPAATRELQEASLSHGEVRFHQQYNVRELIVEYRLLRRIVLEEIHAASGGELSVVEIVVLDMGVDTAFEQGLLGFIHHQKRQIEAGTEVQSKYLRFLSHDLRNNLNQVVLVLDLLRGRLGAMPEFAEDVVDLTAAHRTIRDTMAGMETLLQAERLRNGAIEPKSQHVDLLVLVSDVARPITADAHQKGLHVIFEFPPSAGVNSDRELIALALQNLMGNAVKYSTSGTIGVRIEPPATGQEEGWVVAVSDQGPGIAPENLRRIFEAFARGDTHGQPGIGLGLAIASQAATALGGTISVESQVGVGSTFRLFLPNSPAPRQPPSPTQ